MDTRASYWFSTNSRHIRLPPQAAKLGVRVADACHQVLPSRLSRDTWIRYQIEIARYAGRTAPSVAVLTPVTAAIMETLRQHPWRDQPRMQSAFRLWRQGLRGGYIWIKDGEPLCLQWVFSHHDYRLLQQLPDWAGMYPPLPADYGQVENLLTLPAGLRHPGGAAAPFAQAMYTLAANRGMTRLVTHIHKRNAAARRWAERSGWTAYGLIHRYQIDLPLLRTRYLHIHDVAEAAADGAAAASASSVQHPFSGRR